MYIHHRRSFAAWTTYGRNTNRITWVWARAIVGAVVVPKRAGTPGDTCSPPPCAINTKKTNKRVRVHPSHVHDACVACLGKTQGARDSLYSDSTGLLCSSHSGVDASAARVALCVFRFVPLLAIKTQQRFPAAFFGGRARLSNRTVVTRSVSAHKELGIIPPNELDCSPVTNYHGINNHELP